MSQFGSIGTSATPAPSSRMPPFANNIRSPGTAEGVLRRNLDSSRWVSDAMAPSCCSCHMKFNMIRRRDHCRTCCRVFCDGCSSNRMDNTRTCVACWDRIGRRMSGIGLAMLRSEESTASANADEAVAEGRKPKFALLELLEEHYAKLRTAHHRVLLRRIIEARKRPDHRTTSYNCTQWETIGITLRTKILLWTRTFIPMSGGRLPKRIVFGNLEGTVRRGRGGKEKSGSIAYRAIFGRLV